MHWNPENSEIMPTRQWPTSVTLLPGAVIRIHSLKSTTYLKERVAIISIQDNIFNRLAVSLRDFRAFSGTIVHIREQNLSFLWWGQPPAEWDKWLAGRSLKWAE